LGTLGTYRGGGELGPRHHEIWQKDQFMIEKAELCGRSLLKTDTRSIVLRDACVLGLGFRRQAKRNSNLIPSVASKNYMTFANEFGYYWKHVAPRGRKLNTVTLHLAPSVVPHGAPLKEIVSKSRELLGAELNRRDAQEFMAKHSIGLEYGRYETKLNNRDETALPHAHLQISTPFYRHGAHGFAELLKSAVAVVHEKIASLYPDVFTDEPAARAYVHQADVRSLDALSSYTAKPIVIEPLTMTDDFFRWIFDAHDGAKVFQRFGGFRKWYTAHNKSGNRIEKIGDNYHLIRKIGSPTTMNEKSIDEVEDEVIEDVEAEHEAERERLSEYRAAQASRQGDKVLSEPQKRSSGPMNVLAGVTSPRPDPAGRLTSFMIIQNDGSSRGQNFIEDELNVHLLREQESFNRRVWLRNHCGVVDPDEKDFDVKKYLRPVAEQIYARMNHPDPEYRATIIVNSYVERIIDELMFEIRGPKILKDGDPPF